MSFRTPRAALLTALALAVVAAAGGCDFKVNATGSAVANQPPGYLRSAVPALGMAIGEEKQLAPFVSTADGKPLAEKLNWVSSDPTVVSIDAATGKAVALKLGVAQLIASLPSAPEQKVTIGVNVVAANLVRSIQIEPPTLTLEQGQTRNLIATVRMADGQVNGNVSWVSSDGLIAAVDAGGRVSALKLGRVSIVAAYAPDSQFKGLMELTVVPPGSLATPTPEPTPTPAPTATPTPEPTRTPKPARTPRPTESPSATAAPTATPTAEPTATPSAEPTATPTPEATATPEPTPTPTATPEG